ncbi:TetR/AcrR family transcriptional regulator [Oerskovia flava]|uniref:TetR/AcrR family transcriptional regulator n=1 Tax=Oerskovia flava TaxID=2986422 RepID=UPI0022402E6A|nr:TetR family transcriptional regulator [Oerskovia sp. JB1-3-2]
MAGSGTRRHDPDRRDRIVEVTLDLIVERGLAGATYRTISAAADVPLGSMTYHFATRDDLLLAAFRRFADESFTPLSAEAAQIADPVEAMTAVVLAGDGQRFRILLAELMVLAFRDERYAELVRDWMRRAQGFFAGRIEGVEPHVLDAVQEGLGLHRWFMPEVFTEDVVRGTFRALLRQDPA